MDTIGKVYVLAGVANIGGLLMFNRFYTHSTALAAMAPSVFSTESQMLINLWGLAYIGTARNWKRLPLLNFTFFIEKMVYVFWWYQLMQVEDFRATSLKMVTSGEDIATGVFMLVFGLNDLMFGLTFGYGAWQSFKLSGRGQQHDGNDHKRN